MKKILCLLSVFYLGISWGSQYYKTETTTMDYQDIDDMVDRVMLFDGNEGYYDDLSAEIELPFPFLFYGQEYNSLRVSTNGYLVFPDDQPGDYMGNDPLPSTDEPDGIIAVFWDDLIVQDEGTTDQISYVVQGEAPNRVLIVDYRSVSFFSPSGYIYSQVKLFEGGHVIEFHYDNSYPDIVANASATIGLEHPCGCLADPGPNADNTNSTTPNEAYRFSPVYYTRSEIDMDYITTMNMPGREILFNGGVGSYDDDEAEINLPFTFEFYGTAYDSLRVSTNGYLVFPEGEIGTDFGNDSLPNTGGPNGIIAVFWDDLKVRQNDGYIDQISYVVQGQAPNRVLIIDYQSIGSLSNGDDNIWAQVKLYESSYIIELHYQEDLSDTDSGGVDATMGLEHPCGCLAEPGPNYDNDNDVIPMVAYRYTPNDLIFMNGFND